MCRVVLLPCCLFILALTTCTTAMTDEQRAKIHGHFEKIGMECIKDNPVTDDDIANLRSKKIPTGPNAPCFIACMMKNIGIMDEKGMMNTENTLELAKKVFEDADELNNIKEYLHSCAHVNNEAVSDGEKGCERAMLEFKCMTENALQFGFDL